MDVDIGKAPEPHQMSAPSDPPSIPTLDGWIENLMSCKQLAESDVVRLCDKVCEALGVSVHKEGGLEGVAGLIFAPY